MSIIRALREESEVIKFDNLFTKDLEEEREFDLLFQAEQDDEDLKTIAGNQIMKEDGNEKLFNIPDCVYVNEEGEVKDKDDEAEGEEVEDIASHEVKDTDNDGVSDDIEAAEPAPAQAAPSVVVNVDADDVNINAGDGGTAVDTADAAVEEGADNDITINAKVVNMTANAGAPAAEEAPAPSAEPATTPVPVEEPESDDLEPIGDEESEEAPEEPAGAEEEPVSTDVAVAVVDDEDKSDVTPDTDDGGEPTATAEGVEEIMTPAQLEDILNTGLEPAPAAEPTTFTNTPDDPSTEVVMSDSPDVEVKEDANIAAVKNDENLEASKKIEGEFEDDLAPITDGDVEKVFNAEPEDETKKEEGIDPVKPADVPMNDGTAHEAAEPTKDDPKPLAEEGANIEAVKNDENLEASKKIESEFEDDLEPITDGDVEKIFNDEPEDETKKEEGIDPVKPKDVPMNDGTAHEAAEPTKDDPKPLKEEDGESEELSDDEPEASNTDECGATCSTKECGSNCATEKCNEASDLEPLGEEDIIADPTEGDAPSEMPGIAQADEPKHKDTSELDKPYGKDTSVDKEDGMTTVEDLEISQEAAEPTKDDPKPLKEDDEELTELDAEDSLVGIEPSITDGDLESIYMDKDVDPDKKNDGKLAEAAEPTKDDPKPLAEEGGAIEAVKNDENLEPAKKIEGEFEDDLEPITDGDVEKIFNVEPEDETKKEEGIDPVKPADVPMNDGTAHEAAEPTKSDLTPIGEEEVEIIDTEDIEKKDADISPIGPSEVTPDEVNAPEADMEYDKVAAEKKPVAEADFMDQVNAEDNGDTFTDVHNTGLNIAPEEAEPGSDEELIDDEIIEFIESEN